MPADDIQATGRISPFERIKHSDEAGEYWSARELAKLLSYSGWQKFTPVIEKAEESCKNSGQPLEHHFNRMGKMVPLGSGVQREIEDYHLSRYACYLIVQNADPSTRIVALGRAYFATQTRRQELAQELAGKTEDQQRILLRDQIAEKNGHLAEAASIAGVVTQRDCALFQDHGYRGLYTETARQIASRKGLRPSEHIRDWMGAEETVDYLFRIVQAEAKIRREGIATKEGANDAHLQIGRAVREAIIGMGGTPPEQLPAPEKSLKRLRREESRRQQIEAEGRLRLFAQLNAPDGSSDTDDGN